MVLLRPDEVRMIMTVARIYHPNILETNDRCDIMGEDRAYVLSVLRMKEGERLFLFDGKGHEYETVILGHDSERVSLKIIGKEVKGSETLAITLAQSLPKARKMDDIVEHASSLGVSTIIPFTSERSVSRLLPDRTGPKQRRWQKIALEAARKSHRTVIPEVQSIITFEEMLQRAVPACVKIILWEEEELTDIGQVLHNNVQAREFFLVIGPEGGFSRREIDLARSLGFVSVSLGRQILKVEIAGLTVLAIIHYEKGGFSSAVEGAACEGA